MNYEKGEIMAYACEKCGSPRETADKDGVLVIEPCQECPTEEPNEQRTCEMPDKCDSQTFANRKLKELTAEMITVQRVLERHMPDYIRMRINDLHRDLHEQSERWEAVRSVCIDHKM